MSIFASFIGVAVLVFLAFLGTGVAGLDFVFGIIIPYIAIIIFVVGFVLKILCWAKTPVPFSIITTCGQQKTLSWIEPDNLENPNNIFGVIVRMALEIFLFRSLFRNTKMEVRKGGKIVYGPNLWLWAAGLAFHYSFLVIFIRHCRFFTEPVPFFIPIIDSLDGFFQYWLPAIYISDAVILGAVTFLFLRRVFSPQLRYISLAADYFPLFLILGIVATGALLRYSPARVDIVAVKELAMGWLSFHPTIPETMGTMFYIHLFLVSTLFAYFPFSKLMHLGGIFLSPTRNMTGNTREVRHINPWNPQVKLHSYEAYEDEFRKKMKDAGIPVDKE